MAKYDIETLVSNHDMDGLLEIVVNDDESEQAILALASLEGIKPIQSLFDIWVNDPDCIEKDMGDYGLLVYPGRERALKALPKLVELVGDRAVDPLIDILEGPNPLHRQVSARLLGSTQSPRAVDPLIQGLQDEDLAVRGEAAIGLGKIGDIIALEPLINTFHEVWNSSASDKNYVCATIVVALGKLKDQRSIEVLVFASTHIAQSDLAISALGSVNAVDELIEILNDKRDFARSLAIEGLGRIGDKKAIHPLKGVAKNKLEKPAIREKAVEVLKQFTAN